MRKILLFLVLCFSVASSLNAGPPKFAWDPPDPIGDVIGYKLYYGPSSGNYTNNIDMGFPLDDTYQTTLNLSDGIWYFAATAYSTTQESGYSNEVWVNYGASTSTSISTFTGGTISGGVLQ